MRNQNEKNEIEVLMVGQRIQCHPSKGLKREEGKQRGIKNNLLYICIVYIYIDNVGHHEITVRVLGFVSGGTVHYSST